MQLISVYLYPNKVEAYTNAFSEWTSERYRRVYNRNLKIYRGVDNKVDFQVRNADEKVQTITGYAVVFSPSNVETGELILQKDCIAQSTTTGKVYVNLSSLELQRIEPGNYVYSLHTELRTPIDAENYIVNSKKPLYIDSQYGVNSNIEIYGDIFGEPKDSLVVNAFSERLDYESTAPSTFVSSLIEANSQLTNPQSVHTFQFNMTKFYGTIEIEASQTDGASPHVWTSLLTFESTGDDVLYKNIIGKYKWFRIKHTPRFTENLALFNIRQNTYSFEYTVTIGTGGAGYKVGDIIVIPGRRLNSESPDNDLTITVTSVNSGGRITGIVWSGRSQNGVGEFILSDPEAGSGTVDSIIYR